eukprot:TRINITY_DN96659_c0_g1_i1.p1 TRINITY_DN96659_c0_g1~~TRINITY_DN96659_c0_g1_i1.p1  ORF type:complete len:313 (-),score=16.61 TRINITY_DN96659_c0_g1_i1:4-810(-)
MTFSFGKHRGSSFDRVFETDKSYVGWALSRPAPQGALIDFVRYCRGRLQDDMPHFPKTPERRPARVLEHTPSPLRLVRPRVAASAICASGGGEGGGDGSGGGPDDAIDLIPNSRVLSALAANHGYRLWVIASDSSGAFKGHRIFLDGISGGRLPGSVGALPGDAAPAFVDLHVPPGVAASPQRQSTRLRYLRSFKIHGDNNVLAVPGVTDKNQWVSFAWNDIETIVLCRGRFQLSTYLRNAFDEFERTRAPCPTPLLYRTIRDFEAGR